MVLRLIEVTQEKLFSYADRGQYAGITKDPDRRCDEHEREGYNGVMYYAKTRNMKIAEEKLLEQCPCYRNRQRRSNAPAEEGFIYIIV